MASGEKGAGLVSEAAPDGLKEWMAANDVFRPLRNGARDKKAIFRQRERDMREIARLVGLDVGDELEPALDVAVVDSSKLSMWNWPFGRHHQVAFVFVGSVVEDFKRRVDPGDREFDRHDGEGTLAWRLSGQAWGRSEVADLFSRWFDRVIVCRDGKPERIVRRGETSPQAGRVAFLPSFGIPDFLRKAGSKTATPRTERKPEVFDVPKEVGDTADAGAERARPSTRPIPAVAPKEPEKQVSVWVGLDAYEAVMAEVRSRGETMKTVIAEKVRARLADPASPPPLSGDPVGPRSIGCTVTRREAERIAEVFEGPTISARMRHVLFGVPVGAESTGQKVRVLSASDKGAGARETPEPELFPEPAPAEPEREAVDPEPDDGFDPLPDWPEGEADAGDRDLTEADVRKIERLAVLEFERRSLARRIADLEKSCAIAAVDMPGNMDIDAARGLSRAQLDVACANAERRTGRPVPGRRRRRREKALTVAAAIGLFALVVGYAAS